MPKIRILLVENDEVVRATLAEQLTSAGYSVDEAVSGEVALALLDKNDYQALVAELNMPGGLSGIDVAERAHIGRPDLLLILVTGRPEALETPHANGTRATRSPERLPLAEMVKKVSELLQNEL
jgi:CheY-like chemotaxis protein